MSLRREPERQIHRPLIDGEMTLDSGLRRHDVPGIMLCPDIFGPRLLDEVQLLEVAAYNRYRVQAQPPL